MGSASTCLGPAPQDRAPMQTGSWGWVRWVVGACWEGGVVVVMVVALPPGCAVLVAGAVVVADGWAGAALRSGWFPPQPAMATPATSRTVASGRMGDRKSTRLNSSHPSISY